MARQIRFRIILSFLFFMPVFLSAQTAAELENILDSPAVNCSRAAWFVEAATGSSAATGNGSEAEEAFNSVMSKGWLPKNTAAEDPISLGGLSFLLMKAFGIKGGMMYAIFPGPRYAYRTMVSRSFIQGAADPAMTVSGDRFLMILGNVLNDAGGEE